MPVTAPHIVHLEDGQLNDMSAGDVEAMFQAFPKTASALVIHFHGGLVSASEGKAIAARLHPEYLEAGGFPIFAVWESAWYETIGNNLEEVLKEDFFKALLKLVVKKALDKLGVDADGTRSAGVNVTQVKMELAQADRGKEPFRNVDPGQLRGDEVLTAAEQREFEQELKQDQELGRAVDAIVAQVDAAPAGTSTRSLASGTTQMSPEVLARIRDEKVATGTRAIGLPFRVIKGAIVILVKVIARFVSKRHHGVHATVIEEILREFYAGGVFARVWELMKKDTADSFGQDPTRFGGTVMLQNIWKLWDSDRRPARILLIAHSAGAVYVCHWLKAAETMLPPEAKFEVVFLAPACTVELLAQTLEGHKARISTFRMFSMLDELEKKDAMMRKLKLLYPRSLLYFISGVLEDGSDVPIAGMERFYSGGPFSPQKFPEIFRVLEFFDGIANCRVWSKQAGNPGLGSQCDAHGNFDNDRPTLDSLKHIVKTGF